MKSKISGFSLIEVMIAIVVFSFGLLGVAGIMTVSVRNNHNGYMRTQATTLAKSMFDTMSRNPGALWAGSFNGNNYSGIAATPACAACNTCASIANRETTLWGRMISQNLPNGIGSIQCNTTAGVSPLGQYGCESPVNQPYVGECTITITWNESNEINSASSKNQSLTMKARP